MLLENKIPQLWIVNFDVSENVFRKYQGILSRDELERAKRFRFRKDCVAFTIMRASLRQLLAEYLDCDPQRIQFIYSKFGKPELTFPSAKLSFNVSHTHQIGCIGFSLNAQIGVDIEYVKFSTDLLDVAKKFFSSNEVIQLINMEEKDQPRAFFNCWTRKESFIKAIGHGLSFPLDQFEVSLDTRIKAELLATHFDPLEKNRWSLESLKVPAGYAGAFAVRQKIESYKVRDYNPHQQIG